jgi:uncharacterized protein YjbI with pentapeptide repeats
MNDGKPCGRPVLQNIRVGEKYVCLMHIDYVGKDIIEFQAEFERVLEQAGTDAADFTRFVFPSASFAKRKFKAFCLFHGAKFNCDAEFSWATFQRGADFRNATFVRLADYHAATFSENVGFMSVAFAGAADFRAAVFEKEVNFTFSRFAGDALFGGTKFMQTAAIGAALFSQDAWFMDANFAGRADFSSTEFARNVSFSGAILAGDAVFQCIFRGTIIFERTRFAALVDYRQAHFFGAVVFREVDFRRDPRGRDFEPGPVFANTKFAKPEDVTFYATYLGQALFHLCDVSRVNFSAVTWRGRKRNGKRSVFEEVVNLSVPFAEALMPAEDSLDQRNYVLIAELYQQLKRNYDDRRDYWTAGDFHYGEMEMKRLASHRKNHFLRWLKRRLGLVAWYKYASEYGESYRRPAWLLVLVLLTFGILYPVAGLRYQSPGESPAASAPAEPVDAYTYARGMVSRQDLVNATRLAQPAILTYRYPIPSAEQGHVGCWRARLHLVGHSLLAAILVPLFQRDLIYEPAYPCGRVLAVLEMTLTSTLFALFLLAVRRQFRR